MVNPGSSCSLRPATAADAADIAALHAVCLPLDAATLLGRRFLERRLYPGLIAHARASRVAVAVSGQLVGFVILGQPVRLTAVVDPLTALQAAMRLRVWRTAIDVLRLIRRSPTDLPDCELQWIAVSPSLQGEGVGAAMVRAAMADLAADGVSRVWVKTLASTPGNIAFYERLGFMVVHRVAGRVFLECTMGAGPLDTGSERDDDAC